MEHQLKKRTDVKDIEWWEKKLEEVERDIRESDMKEQRHLRAIEEFEGYLDPIQSSRKVKQGVHNLLN